MPVVRGVTGMVDVGTSMQTHEIVALLLLVAGLIPVVLAARRYGARWFFAGYTAIVVGAVATVAETTMLPQLLNGIEHVATLLAALFFLFTAYWSQEREAGHPRDWRDML